MPIEDVFTITGRGTGVDDAGLQRKIAAIEQALSVNRPDATDPLDVLAKVGGFEIAGLVGVILGAAAQRVPVLIDGFISGAAALLAAELEGGDHALEEVIVGILADDPRPGTPATFKPEQICQIMALACEPPEASGRPTSHWTARELAEEAVQRGIVTAISESSVDRFLKSGGHQAAPEPVLAHAHA